MRPVVAAAFAAAGVAALAVVPAVDGPGRWLVGLAGGVLLAAAQRGALLRPALRVTDAGIDVVVVLRREHVPWADVEEVGASRYRRRLVSSTWLDVDAGDRLIGVPAYRLGAPADEVAAAVSRRRTGPPPPAG